MDYIEEKRNKNKLEMELAVRRTKMSCERSLLSYIRTACVFVSLAFTYLKIAVFDQFDAFVIIMFCIGFFFLGFGLVEYFIVKHKINKMYTNYEGVIKADDIHEDDHAGEE